MLSGSGARQQPEERSSQTCLKPPREASEMSAKIEGVIRTCKVRRAFRSNCPWHLSRQLVSREYRSLKFRVSRDSLERRLRPKIFPPMVSYFVWMPMYL